jgi:hypothetical protein
MGSGASFHGPRSAPIKQKEKERKKRVSVLAYGRPTAGVVKVLASRGPPDERYPGEGVAEASEQADRYQHGNYQGRVLGYGLGE